MQPKSSAPMGAVKDGVNFEAVYFDTGSDTSFSFSVFTQTKDVLDYLKAHFPRAAGGKQAGSESVSAATGMVQERNTYQDSDPTQFYSTADICSVFLKDNQAPGSDLDEEAIGASTAYENIETPYPRRGVICKLNFSVSYAPRDLRSKTPKKMVYMKGPVQPSLVLMGDDLGSLSAPLFSYSIQQDGTGLIEASMQEMRAQVETSRGRTMYLSGDPVLYPIGHDLGGGESVKKATAAPTSYHLRYVLAFFDEGMVHEHRGKACYYKYPYPIMCYSGRVQE